MNKFGLAAATALVITAGVAHASNCLPLSKVYPAKSLSDGYCASTDDEVVAWLQGPDTHEFNQSLAAFLTPGGFIPGYIELLDPASQGGGISDYLLLANSASDPGNVDVAMISNGYSSVEALDFITLYLQDGSPPLLGTLTETGNWQDVSSYFGLPATDVYVTSSVPEPATWAMMILGVGLTGASLRRRAGAATTA